MAMVIGNPMIFRQLPLEEALAKMGQLGYDAIELWPPQIANAEPRSCGAGWRITSRYWG